MDQYGQFNNGGGGYGGSGYGGGGGGYEDQCKCFLRASVFK